MLQKIWYSFFYLWVKVASRIFFSKIYIENIKNIPKEKPVIFALNHQNSLLDALVVATSINRTTHFMARADIFKKSWIARLLNSLNILPIYRIRDGINSLSQNDIILQKCVALLSKNKAIIIFPEGSHDRRRFLRPLKKGIARIGIEAVLTNNNDVSIIPILINYGSHKHSHSWLYINIGEEISTEKYLVLNNQNKAKTAHAILERLYEKMKIGMINYNEQDYYYLLNLIARIFENYNFLKYIFKNAKQNFEFQKKISEKINSIDKATSEKLILLSNNYKSIISKYNLPEKFAGIGYCKIPIWIFIFQGVLFFPYLICKILFFIPQFLIRKLISKFKDNHWEASIKFVGLMLIYPLWISLITLLIICFGFPKSELLIIFSSIVGIITIGILSKNIMNFAYAKLKYLRIKFKNSIDYAKLINIEKEVIEIFNKI